MQLIKCFIVINSTQSLDEFHIQYTVNYFLPFFFLWNRIICLESFEKNILVYQNKLKVSELNAAEMLFEGMQDYFYSCSFAVK